MSVYNPNVPQPTDLLSDSQPVLLANFTKANSSFGIDHYPFADLTANNGKHNQITTPAFVASPPTGNPPITAANEPKMYAFQDSANVGVINYSRGPNDAVPTPLTFLQSPVTPIVLGSGGTTPVLNFNGLSRAMAILSAMDATNPAIDNRAYGLIYVFWNGTTLFTKSLTFNSPAQQGNLNGSTAGSVLSLINNSTNGYPNVFWTLDFRRLS